MKFSARVPWPVVLYAVLGLLDFAFSLVAFDKGYREANPILAWYLDQGLFGPAKIGTTMVIITLGFFLWRLKVVRTVVAVADVGMALLVLYHVGFWLGWFGPGDRPPI